MRGGDIVESGSSWLRSHAEVAITIILLLLSLVAQWTIINNKVAEIAVLQSQLEVHRLDTQHHVDPERDERRWQELIKRLERIEDKIDAKSR